MPHPCWCQTWSLRLILHLDRDKFRCFSHRTWTRQRSTASKLQIGHGACYVSHGTRLVLFIQGITSAKRTHEFWPAVLNGESSTQLLMYSLTTGIRYSILTNYQISEWLHWGPKFSHNYLRLPHRLHYRLHHTLQYKLPHSHRKINR